MFPRIHIEPDLVGLSYNPRAPMANWEVETGESLGAVKPAVTGYAIAN